MIVELLFVKIVFLQLWYAYICFKSYNDQQLWIFTNCCTIDELYTDLIHDHYLI